MKFSQTLNLNLPTILIFDSGVGGLSIYRKVKKLLPNLNYIYAFDNAAFPYGKKSSEFIINRIVQYINQIEKKHKLSLVIIACNTASTVSLPILRNNFQYPIIGVVPAIKTARKLTRNGIIGLLATEATINGNYIKELIKKFAIDCKVIKIASPELVELAEQKFYGQVILKKELIRIVKPLLKLKESPDTIVLGCTHFPLLLTEFKKIFLDNINFVDSGFAIAKRVVHLINNDKIFFITKNKSIAYCTKIDIKTKKFITIMKNEGFNKLEKITN
ncbi:glutamate racemase [Arsenophonus endosymbiont of Lipoptena cervi]|uniref:glutamate racemase n=1 Tax=Arsenophonus endosymbiont of Lipoptena cervi TaxID=363258 RepID=UPI00376EA871